MAGDSQITAAAMAAMQIPLDYLRRGRNMAWAAVAGAQRVEPLRHYPQHDVIDAMARTRFYYHSHPIEGGATEHGHFHIFHEGAGTFHHLAALALNELGQPVRWFSTNRWVTGESWLAAHELKLRIKNFHCQTRGRMAPVARWLQALFLIYQDELLRLTDMRQARLEGLSPMEREAWGNQRDIHVLDSLPIILQDRIQHIIHTTQGVNP